MHNNQPQLRRGAAEHRLVCVSRRRHGIAAAASDLLCPYILMYGSTRTGENKVRHSVFWHHVAWNIIVHEIGAGTALQRLVILEVVALKDDPPSPAHWPRLHGRAAAVHTEHTQAS